jgi:hypothetical protein
MQLIKIFRLLKRHLSGTRDTRGYLCRAQVPEPAIAWCPRTNRTSPVMVSEKWDRAGSPRRHLVSGEVGQSR